MCGCFQSKVCLGNKRRWSVYGYRDPFLRHSVDVRIVTNDKRYEVGAHFNRFFKVISQLEENQ